jgi:hypothetical protein
MNIPFHSEQTLVIVGEKVANGVLRSKKIKEKEP